MAATLASPRLKGFDETLLETANYYDEAFQLYGYKGLADACSEWLKELDRSNHAQTLGDIIKEYKATRGSDWSKGYLQTFHWAKNQLESISDKLLTQLDARHWQIWLPKWRKSGDGRTPPAQVDLRDLEARNGLIVINEGKRADFKLTHCLNLGTSYSLVSMSFCQSRRRGTSMCHPA